MNSFLLIFDIVVVMFFVTLHVTNYCNIQSILDNIILVNNKICDLVDEEVDEEVDEDSKEEVNEEEGDEDSEEEGDEDSEEGDEEVDEENTRKWIFEH
jgi:hypothetical protein